MGLRATGRVSTLGALSLEGLISQDVGEPPFSTGRAHGYLRAAKTPSFRRVGGENPNLVFREGEGDMGLQRDERALGTWGS